MPFFKHPPQIPQALLANAKMYASRYELIHSLKSGGVFAEIGVAFGDFTKFVLNNYKPSKMYAIDIFQLHQYPLLWGKKTSEVFDGKSHYDFFCCEFVSETKNNRLSIIKGDGAEIMRTLDAESIDVVYIDADHRYEPVVRDLQAAKHVCGPGGVIVMNDYTLFDAEGNLEAYGVIQATNEFMISYGWEMIGFALHPGMYCDVALRQVETAS